MSYKELDEKSSAFAAYLQSLEGVEKGDRVAVMMPNLMQYPVTLFGILKAGMIVVNVNPLYTARELNGTLKDSGAKVLVIIENFAKTFEKLLPTVLLSMSLLPRLVTFYLSRKNKSSTLF